MSETSSNPGGLEKESARDIPMESEYDSSNKNVESTQVIEKYLPPDPDDPEHFDTWGFRRIPYTGDGPIWVDKKNEM
jgi:hypothetical protein